MFLAKMDWQRFLQILIAIIYSPTVSNDGWSWSHSGNYLSGFKFSAFPVQPETPIRNWKLVINYLSAFYTFPLIGFKLNAWLLLPFQATMRDKCESFWMGQNVQLRCPVNQTNIRRHFAWIWMKLSSLGCKNETILGKWFECFEKCVNRWRRSKIPWNKGAKCNKNCA